MPIGLQVLTVSNTGFGPQALQHRLNKLIALGRRKARLRSSLSNTCHVDTRCHYFRVTPGELLELYPPLDEDPRCRVDELYPGGRRRPPPQRPGT